jgi:hypothetical protein
MDMHFIPQIDDRPQAFVPFIDALRRYYSYAETGIFRSSTALPAPGKICRNVTEP